MAGCGGSDRLTAKEYREQATKVCTDSQRASDDIRQPTRATSESIADFFRRQLKVNDENVARFRKLEPPEKLQAAHDRSIRALDAAGDEVRKIVSELGTGDDPAEVLTLHRAKLRELAAEQRRAAEALGVPRCAD